MLEFKNWLTLAIKSNVRLIFFESALTITVKFVKKNLATLKGYQFTKFLFRLVHLAKIIIGPLSNDNDRSKKLLLLLR